MELQITLLTLTFIGVLSTANCSHKCANISQTNTSILMGVVQGSPRTCSDISYIDPGITCFDGAIFLPFCYCMSYSKKINTTVFGYCVPRCHVGPRTPERQTCSILTKYRLYQVITHTNNLSEVNRDLCSGLHMNQTGQLCGSCLKGYASPVYSYSMDCVNCTSHYKYNWLKYIAVAYLPLTAFYIFVIVFRLSITSGKMNGYVLTAQLVVAPALVRFLTQTVSTSKSNENATELTAKLLTSFYAISNLDFFRSLYPPFCIHPDMTTVQTLALEYGIAVYPLLLIIVTYIAVSLHYRNSTVVRLWRPFYKCFILLRKEWDIRASLVEAFATFILLSYVKILNTSLDLLAPILLNEVTGKTVKQAYLRASGTVEYFGRDHLPYALLALFMMITFNILPMVLLFLYPCQCFHSCLNYFNIHRQKLHTFVEVFQGSFKTNPRDFRCFAAVYLLIRFINLVFLSLMNGYWYYPFEGVVFFLSALGIALAKPHRSYHHTIVDSVMISCIGTVYISGIMSTLTQYYAASYYKHLFNWVAIFALSIHFIYGIMIILNTLIPRKTKEVFLAACKKLREKSIARNRDNLNSEGELHNYGNLDEYTPLNIQHQLHE